MISEWVARWWSLTDPVNLSLGGRMVGVEGAHPACHHPAAPPRSVRRPRGTSVCPRRSAVSDSLALPPSVYVYSPAVCRGGLTWRTRLRVFALIVRACDAYDQTNRVTFREIIFFLSSVTSSWIELDIDEENEMEKWHRNQKENIVEYDKQLIFQEKQYEENWKMQRFYNSKKKVE